jgi:hypothetical protein
MDGGCKLWKIEGCKCTIGGLRTNLKLISKIKGPNYKLVKELNYDLILGNGESVNEESGKLGVADWFSYRLRVFLQNGEELVCSDLFFLRKLVWSESTTLWTGHGVVHRGPVAVVVHSLAGVWPRRCRGSPGFTAGTSGARGRCEEPILGVSGERAALGRGGRQRWIACKSWKGFVLFSDDVMMIMLLRWIACMRRKLTQQVLLI